MPCGTCATARKKKELDSILNVVTVVQNSESKLVEEKEKEIRELKEKLVEKGKLIENSERENVMLKQENGYLKEINELLKGNKNVKK